MLGAEMRIDRAFGIIDRALADWMDHVACASLDEWADARNNLRDVLLRLDGLRRVVQEAIADLDRGLECIDRTASIRASIKKRATAARGSERELLNGMD